MMIRASAAMLMIGGAMLFVFAKLIPFLELISMDYVGVFMMIGSTIILFFCFPLSMTGLQYDTIPAGTSIVNYIRRDGIIIPVLGKRVFQGESFLDVPGLGIIEDFGKDCVFLWGRKKVRFAVENLSYTPDFKYANYTHELNQLGFDDSDELHAILNIPSIPFNTPEDRDNKAYLLTRMADIYYNLDHPHVRGGERFTKGLKQRQSKKTSYRQHQQHTTRSRHQTQPEQQEETPRFQEITETSQEKNTETYDRERLRKLLGEK